MARITDYLENLLFGDKKEVNINTWTSADTDIQELWSYRLALNIAAERYGSLLSKCEFKTYINGKERKDDNYYVLNVEPNPNQSAAEFKKQLARKLILSPNHDALIVSLNLAGRKQPALYVADSFNRNDRQIYESIFSNVFLDVYEDGGYLLNGTFSGDKAIYIKYSNSELNGIFERLRLLYSQMIENAMQSGTYRQKYVLTMDATAEADGDFEEHLQSLLNEQFGAFIEGKNAVIPIYAGMKLEQTSAGSDLGQNASVANKSVNSQIDEALTKVGLAFNIPKNVMLGETDKLDIDNLLAFCIDPMANLITEAFNRKWYGLTGFQKNTYCRLDTTNVRHIDIVSVADISNGIISSGIYTINDVRKKLNEPEIDGDIGDVHFITRNYAVIGDSYLSDPTNSIVEDNTNQSNVKEDNKDEEVESYD